MGVEQPETKDRYHISQIKSPKVHDQCVKRMQALQHVPIHTEHKSTREIVNRVNTIVNHTHSRTFADLLNKHDLTHNLCNHMVM